MGEIVVVMKDGVLLQSGAPLDIYRDPVNLFVAEFIGSPAMNFLKGNFDAGRGEAVVAEGRGRLRLDPALAGSLAEGRRVELIFGVRPEHLLAAPPPSGASAIDGLVEVVEPLGAETVVEMSLGTQSLTARLKGDLLPATGSVLTLHVEPKSVFVFDPADGARLRAV